MTIQELIVTIDKEKQKRDFMHELTPANVAFFNKMAGGTFEAVMTGGKFRGFGPLVTAKN